MPGIGTFLVRDGREILVDPDPDAGDALLQLALLGPVLAALLQQRGDLVLHASAVEIDGAAVGFLGGRGAGKSTMAAALLRRGYPLLTDDILAVSLEDGSPRVLPGFPQLKLWPDAVARWAAIPCSCRWSARVTTSARRPSAEFPPRARCRSPACTCCPAGTPSRSSRSLRGTRSSRSSPLLRDHVAARRFGAGTVRRSRRAGPTGARPPAPETPRPGPGRPSVTRLVEEDLGTR
jgi:hypothetical protein